ncbi:MAG TPA: hypothetical protein VIU43_08100, partial [Nitrosospira sp.]
QDKGIADDESQESGKHLDFPPGYKMLRTGTSARYDQHRQSILHGPADQGVPDLINLPLNQFKRLCCCRRVINQQVG